MATSVSNFTINKGMLNEYILTIKQNKYLLPMIIDPSDTFKIILINRDTNTVEYEIDSTNLTNPNGHIEIFNEVLIVFNQEKQITRFAPALFKSKDAASKEYPAVAISSISNIVLSLYGLALRGLTVPNFTGC